MVIMRVLILMATIIMIGDKYSPKTMIISNSKITNNGNSNSNSTSNYDKNEVIVIGIVRLIGIVTIRKN